LRSHLPLPSFPTRRSSDLGAWKALVEAQNAGKVRSIGVSNYGIRHLEELENYIKNGGGGQIAVGQYELHPWCGRIDVTEWLKRRSEEHTSELQSRFDLVCR